MHIWNFGYKEKEESFWLHVAVHQPFERSSHEMEDYILILKEPTNLILATPVALQFTFPWLDFSIFSCEKQYEYSYLIPQ